MSDNLTHYRKIYEATVVRSADAFAHDPDEFYWSIRRAQEAALYLVLCDLGGTPEGFSKNSTGVGHLPALVESILKLAEQQGWKLKSPNWRTSLESEVTEVQKWGSVGAHAATRMNAEDSREETTRKQCVDTFARVIQRLRLLSKEPASNPEITKALEDLQAGRRRPTLDEKRKNAEATRDQALSDLTNARSELARCEHDLHTARSEITTLRQQLEDAAATSGAVIAIEPPEPAVLQGATSPSPGAPSHTWRWLAAAGVGLAAGVAISTQFAPGLGRTPVGSKALAGEASPQGARGPANEVPPQSAEVAVPAPPQTGAAPDVAPGGAANPAAAPAPIGAMRCPANTLAITGARIAFRRGPRPRGWGKHGPPPPPPKDPLAFCVDAQPVTTAAFNDALRAGKVAPSDTLHGEGCNLDAHARDLPINCVTWVEAQGYCASRGARLPSIAEWEVAIRAPSPPELTLKTWEWVKDAFPPVTFGYAPPTGETSTGLYFKDRVLDRLEADPELSYWDRPRDDGHRALSFRCVVERARGAQ